MMKSNKRSPDKKAKSRPPQTPAALAEWKLSRLGGDKQLVARLAKAGFKSLPQIALLDVKTFKGKLTPPEAKRLAILQQNARRLVTHAADRAVIQMQSQSAGGNWLMGSGLVTPPGKKKPDPFKFPCNCGCCDSIFGLKAYLFDLLDLLAHYWSLDLSTVEKLLLRSYGKITVYDPLKSVFQKRDLDCDALNAPLPQARITCEVMEVYVQALGKSVTGAKWPDQFVDGLLRLILPQQVAVAMAGADPQLASRKHRFTIAKVEAASNLPTGFATALGRWKTELNTLTPDLAGIDRGTALLADNSQGMIGSEPDGTFAERRDTTVRQWLTDYRDALRTASGVNKDTLEVSLFISLDSGSCRTTTRLQELVTSVQQIVESIRSGEIARLNRPDLSTAVATLLHEAATLPLAESAWTRLRDYETWLGYMYGWVYPENVLSPLVPDLGGESFDDVLKQLQTNPLTAESARAIYLDAVTSLKAEPA